MQDIYCKTCFSKTWRKHEWLVMTLKKWHWNGEDMKNDNRLKAHYSIKEESCFIWSEAQSNPGTSLILLTVRSWIRYGFFMLMMLLHDKPQLLRPDSCFVTHTKTAFYYVYEAPSRVEYLICVSILWSGSSSHMHCFLESRWLLATSV